MLSSDSTAVTLGERVARSAWAGLAPVTRVVQPAQLREHTELVLVLLHEPGLDLVNTGTLLTFPLSFSFPLAFLSLLALLSASLLPASRLLLLLSTGAGVEGLHELLSQRSPGCAPVDDLLGLHAETFRLLHLLARLLRGVLGNNQ